MGYVVLVDKRDAVDVDTTSTWVDDAGWSRRTAGFFEEYGKANEFAKSFNLPCHICGDGVIYYSVDPESVEVGQDFYAEVYKFENGRVYHVVNGTDMIGLL